MDGLKAMPLNTYEEDDIDRQAQLTSKEIYEYHAMYPTPSTSGFIRKYTILYKLYIITINNNKYLILQHLDSFK